MTINNFIVVDCETFFEKGVYDLRSMSMTEYIRDRRFKLHGYAAGFADREPIWNIPMETEGCDSVPHLEALDWSQTAMVGHNIKFDGAVLAWHYGIKPALYVDTM